MHLLLALALNVAAASATPAPSYEPETHLVPRLKLAGVEAPVVSTVDDHRRFVVAEFAGGALVNLAAESTLAAGEMVFVGGAFFLDLLEAAMGGGAAMTNTQIAFISSLVVDGVYLLASPLVASVTSLLVARMMGDEGGSLARALLASYSVAAADAAVVALFVGLSALSAQGDPNFSANMFGAGMLVGLAVQMVGIPLAAAIGFHWGEAPSAQPAPHLGPVPAPAPQGPALPPPPPAMPSYPPAPAAVYFPLVHATF